MAKLDKWTRNRFLSVMLDNQREYIFRWNNHEIKDYFIIREVIQKDDKKRKKEFKEFCAANNYEIAYSVITNNLKHKTGFIAYAGYRALSNADRAAQQAEKKQQDRLAKEAALEVAFENWKRLRAVIRESSKSIIRWKGKFEGDAAEWLDEDEVSLDENEHYYIYRIFVKEKDLHRMFNDWKKTCRFALEESTIQNWLSERPNPLPVWELLKKVIPYYTHWDKVLANGKRERGRYKSSIFFKFECLAEDNKEATLW